MPDSVFAEMAFPFLLWNKAYMSIPNYSNDEKSKCVRASVNENVQKARECALWIGELVIFRALMNSWLAISWWFGEFDDLPSSCLGISWTDLPRLPLVSVGFWVGYTKTKVPLRLCTWGAPLFISWMNAVSLRLPLRPDFVNC